MRFQLGQHVQRALNVREAHEEDAEGQRQLPGSTFELDFAVDGEDLVSSMNVVQVPQCVDSCWNQEDGTFFGAVLCCSCSRQSLSMKGAMLLYSGFT